MTSLSPVVRHTLRRLVRTPAFAIATLLTLSLGIGASVLVFSVVDAVLLRPLPFDKPGQRVWERKYGGAPSIIGRRVEIDGMPHEIVGIMPARFDFPSSRTELWLPIHIDPLRTKSAAFDFHAIGRLRSGVSKPVAAAEL